MLKIDELVDDITGEGDDLPATLRATLERGLGADLSAVRLHRGPAVDRAARRLGADAFACGCHIYVRDEAFRPGTSAGLRLIAHEAAHLVQQAGGRPARDLVLGRPGDPREAEADRWADRVVAGLPAARKKVVRVRAGLSGLVQRHLSFEHRFLGDMGTADVTALWGTPAERRRILDTQLRLLEKWQPTSDVSRDQIKAICPWIRTVEIGPAKLLVTYGELNALPDYLPDAAAIDSTPPDVLVGILQSIRQEGYNQLSKVLNGVNPEQRFFKSVSGFYHSDLADALIESLELDERTSGLGPMGVDHYSGLLARNACHFAPYTWYRWQTSHLIARDYARRSFLQNKDERLERQAWVYHGYADHFLQDSFAAGHLVNKTLVMQWFVEWAAAERFGVFRPMDWDAVRTMTTALQPGLVDRKLYDNPWLGRVSNDPQTVQEIQSVIGRIDGSGVVASGKTAKVDAYQNYLTFLTGSATQLASAALHDHFNSTSVWVSTYEDTRPVEIWGDDTLLSEPGGRNGATATSGAAQMSRQALLDILGTGATSITVERLFRRFPTAVGNGPDRMGSLLTWASGLKSLCQDDVFPGIRAKILLSKANPRLGIVSRDQVFGQVWYRKVAKAKDYPEATPLVHGGVLYVGAQGAVYALDVTSGATIRQVVLDPGGGDVRLATDGTRLFAGVNQHVHARSLTDLSEAWRLKLPGATSHEVSLLHENGRLFAGSNGWVCWLNPVNGDRLRNPLRLSSLGIETNLATDGTTLYVGLYGSVYGVTVHGDWSKEAWSCSLHGLEHVNVLVTGGRLYAGSNGWAYRLSTAGKLQDSTLLASRIGAGNYETRLAADGSQLFAGSHGYVYALPLTAAWRAPTWTTSLDGYAKVDVLVNDGRLFAGSNGHAYQLDPAGGTAPHDLLLTFGGAGIGEYRTQLTCDGAYLYGGTHGYAYKVVINDSWLGGGPIYRDLLTSAKWQGSWTRPAKAPATVRAVEMRMGPQNNMETFACGVNGTLYHAWKALDGTWHEEWTPNFCKAPPLAEVKAIIGAQSNLEVVGVGADGVLQHTVLYKDTSKGWKGYWTPMDGAPPGVQSVFLLRASDRADLLAIDQNGVLHHTTQNYGGWSRIWTPNFRDAPALRSVTGRYSSGKWGSQFFGIGTDGVLHHITCRGQEWDRSWTPRFLNAPPLRSIALGARTGGNVQAFAIGTDGTLRVTELVGGRWTDLTVPPWNTPPLTSIGAMAGPQNNLEVFGVGVDGRLHHTAQFAEAWQGYWTASFDNAPKPVSSVALDTDGQGNLNVFTVRES